MTVSLALVAGCIGSESSNLGNNTKLVKSGYVRLCKPNKSGGIVKSVDKCEIAEVSNIGNPGYEIGYNLSRTGPDSYGVDFKVVDFGPRVAVVEIDQRHIMQGKGHNFLYKALIKRDANNFLVYGIKCQFSEQILKKLSQAGISFQNGNTCNVSSLGYPKIYDFFRIVLSEKWEIDSTEENFQITYPVDQKRAGEIYLAQYRKDHESNQAVATTKKTQDNRTLEEIEADIQRLEDEQKRREARERCIRSHSINEYADGIGASLKCGFD